MTIEKPNQQDIPQLRALWKLAFGDTDAFLDGFFDRGYSAERCRLVRLEGRVAAAAYWLDCSCENKPFAYIYAVATHPDFRGKGLCRALLTHVHQSLTQAGYAGAALVPSNGPLFSLYEKLGYRTISCVRRFTCSAGSNPVAMEKLDAQQYAAMRRNYLSKDAILQEGETLAFLSSYCGFYAGSDWLLAAYRDGTGLTGMELLGNAGAAEGILAALGAAEGRFRTPGAEPFAMYLPLQQDCPVPGYLGLALD